MDGESSLEAYRLSGVQPIKQIRTPAAKKKPKQTQPFIRGPLPLPWIKRSANISRRSAVVVGLVLWHLAGFREERTDLVLCVSRCEPFGLGRKSVARGLSDLEAAGLIRVKRSPGKCPRVDILDFHPQQETL